MRSSIVKALPALLATLLPVCAARANAVFPEDSTSAVQNEIVLDLSLFPSSEAGGEYGWSPTIAIRTGLSKNVVRTVNVEGYLEYYQLRLPNGEGNTFFSPPGTKRHDIAIYAGLSFSRMLMFGLGTYYTTSSQVVGTDLGYSEPWKYSGFSEFRFFWTLGFNYDVHLVDQFFMPIGIHYRNSYRSNGGIMFIRIGTAVRF